MKNKFLILISYILSGFIALILFIILVLFLNLNVVSANTGMACIGCPQNGIINHTATCDIKGKFFDAGAYNWTVIDNGTIIETGIKRVDNTGQFCIKDVIPDCGKYEINFGYAKYSFNKECEIPVVPEFSFITGLISFLGATGTFFLIRRKNE